MDGDVTTTAARTPRRARIRRRRGLATARRAALGWCTVVALVVFGFAETMADGTAARVAPVAAALVAPTSTAGADRPPEGALGSLAWTGNGLEVSGWVVDPDAPDEPVEVVVSWQGRRQLGSFVADEPRPDGGVRFVTGFPIDPEAGVHTFCARGLDPELGAAGSLGCRAITVFGGSLPVGSIDHVAVGSDGKAAVSGWALDPDDPSVSIGVRLEVVGHGVVAEVMADGQRVELPVAFPGISDRHGFDEVLDVDLGEGVHTVCAHADHVGYGRDRLVACEQVAGGGQRPASAGPGAEPVYLTFDDGPWPDSTAAVLDVLATHGAKATFFVLGSAAASYGQHTQRALAEGHSIQNHTWSHPRLTALGNGAIASELSSTNTIIESLGAPRPTCMRPPAGVVDGRVRAVAASLGLRTVLWSVDSEDWRRPGSGQVVHNVLSQVRPGVNVLFHDGGDHRTNTVDALRVILTELDERGYTFDVVC